jgi:hypothetical protein
MTHTTKGIAVQPTFAVDAVAVVVTSHPDAPA